MESFSQNQEGNPVDPIDLTIFKDHIRQSLMNILESMPSGEKTLVLEKSCIPKLNYFATLENLKEKNIRKELIVLKKSPYLSDSPIIIYMIPPEREFVKIIEKNIEENNKNIINKVTKETKKITQGETSKEYHLIFIPKITSECQSVIKNSNYRAYFNIHNLNIDIFSLDYDLMSLENKDAFYDLYIDKNLNCLSVLTRSIIKYETVFGKIKYKYAKGELAKKLYSNLTKEEESTSLESETETLACIMLDRNVDLVTPLCSQSTYEGLLDENFDINFNTIRVPAKLLEKDKGDTCKLDLSGKDKFYSKIKDFNFSKIRSYLPAILQEHSKILEEGKRKNDDMKQIQKNLDDIKRVKDERQSLTNHINLADYISQSQKLPLFKFYMNFEFSLLYGDLPSKFHDFIDDEFSKKSDEYNILRMLCLESVIQSGIKYKIYDQFKKDFMNIYGFQKLILWHNLEKAGILKPQDSNSFYSDANKKLKLFFDDVDENNPNDISYAFKGYAPISIRLIEKAVTQGWNSIKDILKKIPGDTDFPADESEVTGNSEGKKFILLVFIGGLTYGELAAIRYLNSKTNNKKFIVLTTGMISAKKMFDSLGQGKFFLNLHDEASLSSSANNQEDSDYSFKDFFEELQEKKFNK